MPKGFKLLLAILLLPACVGMGRALGAVLGASGGADTTWVPMLAGAVCWLIVYLLLPRPMWLYVAGHELTHALWVWLFGGRVRRLRISASGGDVVVTKSNFLIALAPYFFPLYAALVVLAFFAAARLWPHAELTVWFHLLLGVTLAFHLTLTAHVLKTRQTDITSQGYLFSGVVIFLGNSLVLLAGIPLLTGQPRTGTALTWWWQETLWVWRELLALAR